MDYNLRLLCFMFLLLLLTACSTSPITGMFEWINASDPLPPEYTQRATENFTSRPPTKTGAYSSGLNNLSNTNANNNNSNNNNSNESSFEEWHNNQY